ncbi:hypothetical protein HFP57_13925 [Parasphingopyxis algicola]|uniref:hypothetical protein n=1 Tax=Parasphingopyxis algicola TaxID=2026624 RepID=UPI0015A02DAD|nr:hypothetical protein [Parasphingopyxis algicola]QLC26013.1 hypothetical protein HFP57_13925 [Parasphingopyxis algicola]
MTDQNSLEKSAGHGRLAAIARRVEVMAALIDSPDGGITELEVRLAELEHKVEEIEREK